MTIRALVFDFDNTLWRNNGDTDVQLLCVLRSFGVEGKDSTLLAEIHSYCSDREILRRYVPRTCFSAAYREVVAINKQAMGKGSFFPEVVMMLTRLAATYELYIQSGRDRSSLLAGLYQMRIRKLFKDLCWDRFGIRGKPHPDGLLYLLEKHRLDPLRTVYIGDRDSDHLAAQAAGCNFLGACWYSNHLTTNAVRCYEPSMVEKLLFLRGSAKRLVHEDLTALLPE